MAVGVVGVDGVLVAFDVVGIGIGKAVGDDDGGDGDCDWLSSFAWLIS